MRRLAVPTALAILVLPSVAAAQHGASAAVAATEGVDFRVYDGEGRPKLLADVVASMDGADVMLVGESHDDAVGHVVEARLLYGAAQRVGATSDDPERPVILSLEMFDRDVQDVLDEYLQGLITEGDLLKSARPWDNYGTDYRPLVEFARTHHLEVLAANAPRRYVNRVLRLGPESLDALSPEAKRSLPPLPYPGPSDAYTSQWNALMKRMAAEARQAADSARDPADSAAADEGMGAHEMKYALDAQALWDADMAYAITQALDARPGAFVLHVSGAFHVERGTGIPEDVQRYRPGTRVVTVVIDPTADVDTFVESEDKGLGDFVVLTRKGG